MSRQRGHQARKLRAIDLVSVYASSMAFDIVGLAEGALGHEGIPMQRGKA
jgi:hypothetical protein